MIFKQLFGLIKILVVFAAVWVFIWFYNANGCAKVEGPDMAPDVEPGRHWVSPGVQQAQDLDPTDIVIFTYAKRIRGRPGKLRETAARVVALPGDTVNIEAGDVFVNGKKVAAGGAKGSADYQELIVPRGTVFVLCNNSRLGERYDSRAVGPVGVWSIKGRIR